jgi:C4-dicarboxylate transporter, DctM subunit
MVALIFIIFLCLGLPIVFVLGLTATIYTYLQDTSLLLVPQRMFVQIDSFVLEAVPFFMLAGNLLSEGGFTARILRLCKAFVGHVRGGLAYVNIMASMLFAGISGSALADVFGLGPIEIDIMTKDGYKKDFSAAVTAASAIIGPIIPPSIPFVIFGAIGEVSIAALLLGGLLPGILLGLCMMAVVWYQARSRNFPKAPRRSSIKEMGKATMESILAVIAPLIILGGILSGVFTPTEAAVIAVVFALIVSLVIYKEIRVSDLPRIFLNSAVSTAACFLIISAAGIFGWMLAAEEVPVRMMEFFKSISDNPYVFLFIINIALLFIGCWMDLTATLIVLGPILLPVAKSMGIDPVHFGVMMVLNLEVGQLTPPLGLCLFGAATVSGEKVESIIKELWPFIIACIVAVFLVTYVPMISLLLPNLFLK